MPKRETKEERLGRLARAKDVVQARREVLQAPVDVVADDADDEQEVEKEESPEGRRARLSLLRAEAASARRRRQDCVEIATDSRGNEMLVLRQGVAAGTGFNRVVMMAWERSYMEACVAALSIGQRDAVLEVGFGLGFSATAIMAAKPARHTILECASTVFARAAQFATESQTPTEVRETTWQRYLQEEAEEDPMFDVVFFDDFPLETAVKRNPDASRWHTFLRAAEPRLNDGARISGYLVDGAVPMDSLPEGFSLLSQSVFEVEPPEDCPYFSKDDVCLVVIFRYENQHINDRR